MKEFQDVFERELDNLEGELHMVTGPNVAVREKVRVELDKLLALEAITPADSPTDWISSVVITMKPNGQARLCIVIQHHSIRH